MPFVWTRKGEMLHGIRDFVGPYKVVSPPDLDAALIQRKLGLKKIHPVLRAIETTGWQTGTAFIDAEIATLGTRFGVEEQPEVPQALNTDVRLHPIRHYVRATEPAGQIIVRHVRYRNAGAWISSDEAGNGAVHLAYHWLRDGEVHTWDGQRSTLISAIAPGREASFPMTIQTPEEPGNYTLQIVPLIELRGWLSDMALDIPVRISKATLLPLPMARRSPVAGTYAGEHAKAISLINDWCGDRKDLKMLEVAAGGSPHLLPFANEHSVLASDICLNQMILAAAQSAQFGIAMHFATIDAFDPPLANEQFDVVSMFSALHHFPEPERTLQALARLTKPDGIVAVMCEPMGARPDNHEFVRDFALGVNEQWFELEEYAEIIKAAGLTPAVVEINGGAINMLLRKD